MVFQRCCCYSTIFKHSSFPIAASQPFHLAIQQLPWLVPSHHGAIASCVCVCVWSKNVLCEECYFVYLYAYVWCSICLPPCVRANTYEVGNAGTRTLGFWKVSLSVLHQWVSQSQDPFPISLSGFGRWHNWAKYNNKSMKVIGYL